MNFASAFIGLQRGHKIKRSHWGGYWKLEDGKVMIHTCDGKVINLLDTEDVMFTLSNCAYDDWEIAYNSVKTKE